MGKRKDITGRRFGSLVAIKLSHRADKRTYWTFKCDCGNLTEPRRVDSVGCSSSCGVGLCSPRIKNIIGQRFGKLLVTGFSHSAGEYTYWMCECECGKNTHPISSTCLRGGLTKSCGHGLCNGKIHDLVGQSFGNLVVIEFSHSQRFDSGISMAYWVCKCKCGTITKPIQATHLKSGNIRGCGCCRLLSETDLFNVIADMFSDHIYSIKRHFSPAWLKPQHVDGVVFRDKEMIFGFEYDGEQHFRPIKSWGGVKKLEYQKTLDRNKDEAFDRMGIPLLRISYRSKDSDGKICIDDVLNELKKLKIKTESENVKIG